MPVVGTAGHVDHGKSTLIRALTGRDPDRWREEKERGLTIDLGFAWATLPSGTEVSFVDVPGHERFIKNMLAGIEAIDVAILVVAADEGWMPQSEEHLAVLDLLGVERGVVALTKVDRVDDDLLQLAQLEVAERLEGTSLEGAPIVPISAPADAGIDDLRTHLDRQLATLPPTSNVRPRMWIDRSFTIAGAGTVVTGTLLGGGLEVGQRVAIWPGAHEVRIRAIQSHEQDVPEIGPGRRVALNVSGLDRSEIGRGAMLGIPEDWTTTSRVAVTIRPARYVDELTNRGAYHLHVGSGGWPIRLRMHGTDLAIINLPEPLPLEMGDRFVIRETGRRQVVGGGRVIDPSPRSGRALLRTVNDSRAADALTESLDAPANARAQALLDHHGSERLSWLRAASGGGEPHGAVVIGDLAFEESTAERLVDRLVDVVRTHHEEHPLRPGLPLAGAAGVIDASIDVVTALAARSDDLVIEGPVLRLCSFSGARDDAQEKAWQEARRTLQAAGTASVPRVADLVLDPDLLHALVREGSLVRVSNEFVYLPEQIEEMTEVMRSFTEPFTVSEFKDRAAVSRKYAVPLLEWADDKGITVRMGDKRRLRG